MKYAIGQKIYYTGDMANHSGRFEIIHSNCSQFGGNQYDMKEMGGDRVFNGVWEIGIGDKYNGTCNPRFVTAESYGAWRKGQYEALQLYIEKMQPDKIPVNAE